MSEIVVKKKVMNPNSLANLTARGRPKGCKNKTTNLKQAVLDTFDRLGGSVGLYKWVNEKPKHKEIFYGTLFAKMLPKHVDLESQTLGDVASRLIEARKMSQNLLTEGDVIDGKVLEVTSRGIISEGIKEAVEDEEEED